MQEQPISMQTDIVSAIMRASLDCIVVANHAGQIIEFNPAAESVFGYSRSEVMFQPMADFIIPPRYRSAHAKGMEHYLTTGEGPVINQRIEISALRADGSEFPIELTIIPSHMGDEPIFLSFIRDITDRKKNQEKLLRTGARLAEVISNLKGGMLVEDESRHIALVNQAFCDMFAIPVSPQLLVGTDCSGSAEASKHLFVEPQKFVMRIDTILSERQVVLGETLHLQDGRVFSRDYVPVFSADEYIGHLWHYHDITELMQTQRRWERLLKLEEVNKEINRIFLQLDDLDVAMAQVLELTGQQLDVSRVYVFHVRENERVMDNTYEWCSVGVKPKITNRQSLPFDTLFPSLFPLIALNEVIAPRHVGELPEDLRILLETRGIESVLWMPLHLNNRVEGFIGYDDVRQPREWLPEEITMVRIFAESYARALERKQNDRLLIQARDEALRTAQLRTQFVANMSHEIRTPMTGTMGMLELLQNTELNELQREFASEAFRCSSQLLEIINDILDFSKLEAGQLVLGAYPVELEAIVTEVKMTLMPQVRNKPVEIRAKIDRKIPYRVFGDATRIRQVMMNLAGNAVKFTHSGHVQLSIDVIKIVQDIAYLRFQVSDTGIGIAPHALDRIFESFVQADGSTTRKYGGTGLGLSISKQLVELMGGNLSVQSAEGQGSIFSFVLRFPIAQGSNSDGTSQVQFNDLQVAIVDKKRTSGFVLAQQLENWGIRVSQTYALAQLEGTITKKGRLFDFIFVHSYSDLDENEDVQQYAPFGEQIVLVRNTPAKVVANDTLELSWPTDASSLFNLIIHNVHKRLPKIATQQFDEPAPIHCRILLADDYKINHELVKRALMDLPVYVDAVENGQQVFDQLEKAHYDLVLMDIQMPLMDGVEATKRIRNSSSYYRTIPVIALTASVMREEQEKYLATGIDAIISKPFSLKSLREVVLSWLKDVKPTTTTDLNK